jgi:SAM-dependent methyltransferase
MVVGCRLSVVGLILLIHLLWLGVVDLSSGSRAESREQRKEFRAKSYFVLCDVADKTHGDSAFGQKTPIIDSGEINVIPLEHPVQLPFANESFDVVLSFGVLEHVSNDMESLREINRILKSEGLFFCFFLPYKYSWKQKRDHLKGSFYHDHLYDMKIARKLLDNTGFTLTDYWYRDLFPKRFAPPFYRWIENMDNWICRNTVFKHFASNIEFVARKKV